MMINSKQVHITWITCQELVCLVFVASHDTFFCRVYLPVAMIDLEIYGCSVAFSMLDRNRKSYFGPKL